MNEWMKSVYLRWNFKKWEELRRDQKALLYKAYSPMNNALALHIESEGEQTFKNDFKFCVLMENSTNYMETSLFDI